MQTISKLFAEIGFKVNTAGLKDFQAQMKAVNAGIKAQIQDSKAQLAASKAVEAAHKADTAEIKKGIATQNLKKSAIQTETAELRKLDLEQRMETRAQRAADAQRQRSISSLRRFIVGISAAAYAVTKLTQQTRAHALAYRDYAFQTGMPIENLQKLEAAAAHVAPGLSGNQIASELTTLQQNLTNIEFGQGDIFPYQLLGISATTRDATKIVEGLRGAISKLDNVRAINLIERMGLSRDWLYILRMTREDMEKIEAVMLSKEQRNSVIGMSLALNKLKFSLSNLRDQVVAFASGTITVFTENFSKAVNEISLFIKESKDAPAVLGLFAAALGALSLSVAPLTTSLLALYLLLEDMYVFSKGGDSLFEWGDVNGKNGWGAFKAGIEGIVEAFTEIGKIIYSIGNEIGDLIFALTHPIETLKQSFRELLPYLKGMLRWAGIDIEDESSSISRRPPHSINSSALMTPLPTALMSPVINNNVNMNGYTPIEGGEFIGALNQNQSKISENNLTASQMTTIGSAS